PLGLLRNTWSGRSSAPRTSCQSLVDEIMATAARLVEELLEWTLDVALGVLIVHEHYRVPIVRLYHQSEGPGEQCQVGLIVPAIGAHAQQPSVTDHPLPGASHDAARTERAAMEYTGPANARIVAFLANILVEQNHPHHGVPLPGECGFPIRIPDRRAEVCHRSNNVLF